MFYSKRLEEATPTSFFLNNPTPSEAKAALEIGNVIGIVTNGNYLKRMLTTPETKDSTIACIDRFIAEGIEDDQLIVALAAQEALKKCASYYLPMFEKTQGAMGWAAIQGNPNHDTDYDFMVAEAKRFYNVTPKMRVKFPATVEAMQALETMTGAGKATLATCGFSVQYAAAAMEAYKRGCEKFGQGVPRLYVTLLAGHIDEYLEKYVKANAITISPDVLSKAGCEIAKEVYKTWKEKYHDLNCRILGGCRATWHYTEMVPGDMSVTVNYDFIEELNALNPEIESRIDVRESDAVVNELKEKLPAFAFSISQDSRIYQHWSLVPTALYFRNYVRAGWNTAAATVRERRLMFR